MARFLFVVPALAGHVNPTISVGRDLAGRGHDVAWAGPPGELARLLPPDVVFMPVGATMPARPLGLRSAAAFQAMWQDVLIPLARSMAGDLDTLVDWWQPDVLVVDKEALAGAVVARRRRLRWATLASSSAELEDPLAAFPAVAAWLRDQLAAFQAEVGAPDRPPEAGDLRWSEHLVLVFSTRRLVGEHRDVSPHVAFVGPAVAGRSEPVPFPWDWLDAEVPHVLVSLGTVNTRAGERFFAAAAEALGRQPLQAVLVAPPELLAGRDLADNVLVRSRVPQLALLRSMDAVVCHGGNNTVCEALAHGLPLVLAPVVDDQPVIANQVVAAGAGVRVPFARVDAGALRSATQDVLARPSFKEAAAAVAASFRAAGGARAAAGRLEALARQGQSTGATL